MPTRAAPSDAAPSTPQATPPILTIVSGLVASGKSTVARALAARRSYIHLEADRIRDTLLESTSEQANMPGAEARWRRDLSPGFESEIYADLLRRADLALAAGQSVVLDACFPRRAQRDAARAIAAKHGAAFLLVFCTTSEANLEARLDERDAREERPVWRALYDRLAEHYELLDDIDPSVRLDVLTDGEVGPIVDGIEARLQAIVGRRSARSRPVAKLEPAVVSFDCWGTLLIEEDWPWAHALRVRALQDAARQAGRALSDTEAEEIFRVAWARHQDLWEAGLASGAREIAGWAFENLGIEPEEGVRAELVWRFEEASHTSRVVALEGARELLGALTLRGTPCVLVCDTGLTPGRVVRGLLDRAGLLELLCVQAFSDEVGVPKPDPRPFLAALAPLGVLPEAAVHVGDLRRTDIAGARALGMQSVRIRARHDDQSDVADADWVVDTYTELAGLLGLG